MGGPHLVVFCHLRWDFVYQRPQQLLSRLAHGRRVIFIEEPVSDAAGEAYWQRSTPEPNVLVARPHSPHSRRGFHPEHDRWLGPLVRRLIENEKIDSYIAWFYTPMAVSLLENLKPQAVVYDCMDELTGFLHAPAELVDSERALLSKADVVFTGGRSLFRAKQPLHPQVYCFPSSVDAAHFGQARTGTQPPLAEPDDQRPIPRPRLGFFGVIDERLDVEILNHLATTHPQWQVMMVGPVVKIDPATLPHRPNIHFIPQRPYAELPRYLSGWDVCLLPFARNDATRFISPTKTLEYMAAERPIVSTPIADVAEPYGDIVYLGETPEQFAAACEAALAAPEAERQRRFAAMREVLTRTSWDETAAEMEKIILAAAAKKPVAADRTAKPASEILRGSETGRARGDTPPVVVIGAGPTGLSAAYHLGEDALLVEQADDVGGWCRSITIGGFTFDYAGHIMFSNDPYVHELYEMLLGDNVHWQNREAWIYSHGVHTRYPFQGALYGLPPKVIAECIIGAIEARFGPIHESSGTPAKNACQRGISGRNGSAARTESLALRPTSLDDCCGDGILESTASLVERDDVAREPRNFEQFIYQVWGAGIAKHFAIPYNRKLWAVDLKEMETSWLGGRVPLPDLAEMIQGALEPVPKPMGPNARFGYPLRGGFQALMRGFLPHLAREPLLDSRVIGVSPTRRTVTLADHRQLPYEKLISTMPLPALVRASGEEAPRDIRLAAQALRYVSVRCVHLGVGRENLTEKHWVYYPEDTVFHRIFVQGNASPHCNPSGGFGLTCEITYSPHKPLPCDGAALVARCIEDCRRVGMIGRRDPIWATAQVDLPHAYVVYDHTRPRLVEQIRQWMARHDIILAGRYGEWEYYNSDHAFLAGRKAAQQCSRSITVDTV